MYRCESWTIKKAEHWRIDAFKLWCWRWLLRVPLTARRTNKSILKEINPEYSLEGLMLKLNLPNSGHLMQKADSLEKTLMQERLSARGEGDYRGWDGWMASLSQWTWVWANSRRWWRTGKPGVLQFMGLQRVRHNYPKWKQKTVVFLFLEYSHFLPSLCLIEACASSWKIDIFQVMVYLPVMVPISHQKGPLLYCSTKAALSLLVVAIQVPFSELNALQVPRLENI